MSARIVASGGDTTVAVLWVVFVVIVVVAVVSAVVMVRRYNQNRHTLRGEGLGPLSAESRASRFGWCASMHPITLTPAG